MLSAHKVLNSAHTCCDLTVFIFFSRPRPFLYTYSFLLWPLTLRRCRPRLCFVCVESQTGCRPHAILLAHRGTTHSIYTASNQKKKRPSVISVQHVSPCRFLLVGQVLAVWRGNISARPAKRGRFLRLFVIPFFLLDANRPNQNLGTTMRVF